MLQTKHFSFNYLKLSILYRLYYIKYYYPFWFLHKPLCEKYKNDSLLFFNKIYFCRSCFYLYFGAILGVAFGLFVIVSSKALYGLLSVGLSVIALSYPPIYKHYSRIMRDALRFCTGFFSTSLMIFLLKVNWIYGIIFVLSLFGLKSVYNKKRNPAKVCEGCAELSKKSACSGYRKQTDALLELEENFSKHLTIRKDLFYD